MQGVCQQSESFACALLLPEKEVRRPLAEGVCCFWPETVDTPGLTQEVYVSGQAAAEAVRVTTHGAVVAPVPQEAVRKRNGGGQTGAERVEEASVAYVVDACVVGAHVQQGVFRQALQAGNGRWRSERGRQRRVTW